MSKKLIFIFCVYSAICIVVPNMVPLIALIGHPAATSHLLNVGAYFLLMSLIVWSLVDFYRLKKWAYYFQIVFTALQILSVEGDISFSLSWSIIKVGITILPRIGSHNITFVFDVIPCVMLVLLLAYAKKSFARTVPGTRGTGQ